MGHRHPQELLLELRTYLQHFEQTGHLGESEAIAEIKHRIEGRIREVEAQLRIDPPKKTVKSSQQSSDLESRIAS
jgi:hypothetical protein